MASVTALLLALLVFGTVPGVVSTVHADEGHPTTSYTARATLLCERADDLSGRHAEAMLREGLRLAELAVERDDRDAHAHFALFCALGKLLERDRVGLGSVRKVRRLRRVIDRTLEIEPDYIAANIAKAELLARLPGWLGGDAAEARRYRARAVALQVEQSAHALAVRTDAEATVRPEQSSLAANGPVAPDAGS